MPQPQTVQTLRRLSRTGLLIGCVWALERSEPIVLGDDAETIFGSGVLSYEPSTAIRSQALDARHVHPNRPTIQRPQRPAAPTPENVDTNRTFWEWQHLTDDWSGYRPLLEQSGFTFDSSLTIDTSNLFRGGVDPHQTIVRQLFDANLTIDLNKWDWAGGTIFLDYQHQSGQHGSTIAGDFQGFANNGTDGISQLSQIWFEQKFAEDSLRFKLGKVDANSEFAFVENGMRFLNSSMGFSPTIFVFPSYPDPAFSANLFWEPDAYHYLGAGFFDGTGIYGVRTGRAGPSMLFNHLSDFFFITEAGLRWGLQANELPGRLAAGAWYHNGRFVEFGGAVQQGTAGTYFVLDQQLCKENNEANDDQGIAMFWQLGFADPKVSPVSTHVGGGLNWQGAIPGRDRDNLGLGASWVRFSQAPGVSFDEPYELAIETYYQIQFAPWVYSTLDLQYIVNPGGVSTRQDAVVGTLRVGINF